MITDEEKKVLILLGKGETHKDISKTLGLSADRLRAIKRSFIKKLGARNHVHAVYLALSKGLIEITD
jgi:DNA-binding NarL/FixJ family response regulator